jgi:hypothetical protein
MSSIPQPQHNPFLNSWRDSVSDFKVMSLGLCLGDVTGEGENIILLADQDKKLSVYRGINIEWETKLAEIPVAVL